MIKGRRAQSTLEYIAVFAVIVAAIVYFAYSKMGPAVEKIMNSSAAKITTATSNFSSNSSN